MQYQVIKTYNILDNSNNQYTVY